MRDPEQRMSNVVESKRTVRSEAMSKRHAVHESGGGKLALAVRELFLAMIPLARGAAVGGYWPMGAELDIVPVLATLDGRGHVCALPVVEDRHQPLVFHRWRPQDKLIPGVFGTSTPRRDTPQVDPDLLLVPLLAFDVDGYRLGYGGGFYDRTIAGLRRRKKEFLAVGVAFSAQEVPFVPREAFDERLDWIVTDQAARRIDRTKTA
ncbi:MAG: 5-formyltetrahydrofolate cyclo-ligase [Rhodospirillales bacterium]|nr:5-formyltetrahydrofolate cyclo-ligase [Rhodospirillales bacterium]